MMNNTPREILIGNSPLTTQAKQVTGEFVQLLGETYYRIANYDHMPPFFMTLVSGSDHWLFVSSSGGLSAGRVNADSALFPYETVDKITAHHELTGGKTILLVRRAGYTYLWEPFSNRYAGVYRCERNLYKNVSADKLIFEETHHDLQLTLRVAWRTGGRLGFIRTCWLCNEGDEDCEVDLLDGLQNIMPFGATNALQTSYSNLLDGYKRSELAPETGVGIFSLSATLTDRAEPSESLKATVVWHTGLEPAGYLLSTAQLDAFRRGQALVTEQDICGKPGAYFVNARVVLPTKQEAHWHIVADVNQDSADVVRLQHMLRQDKGVIAEEIEADIAQNTATLLRLVAAADGLQKTNQPLISSHHYTNVLFNIMRGGVFIHNHQIERDDLLDFVQTRNRMVLARHASWFAALPAQLSAQRLYALAAATDAPDLIRLCYEYLPLTFSRRHGDPSRPWNSFSINLRRPDGRIRFDYQGNWRDIFQNWESLALSFPGFLDGMLAKFLNATTVDGYNPYRVTRDGIEWEVPDPANPWSNIGYWSDHQIIYLQKLLEIAAHIHPDVLSTWWNRPIFAYANVPYRLRTYQAMLADWYNTIDFDEALDKAIAEAEESLGTDARLLRDATGEVVHGTLTEKLLVLLLAKLTNFVPEGGIWMNTQRPEWNDANNALVGKGLSVVTVAYLRRFVLFWHDLLQDAEAAGFAVSAPVADLLNRVHTILGDYSHYLAEGFTNRVRRKVMDALGEAATDYRAVVYAQGLGGAQVEVPRQTLQDFLALAQAYIEQTLRANRREDGLYHSYNTIRLSEDETAIDNLYLMLEGQVAILSSGMLSPEESLEVLRSLQHSALYRADQHTYMLYPYRRLPGFLEKNNIPPERVRDSALVAALTAAGDTRLVVRDIAGVYHFNGEFRNANDAARVLDELATEPAYAELATAERHFILDLFESIFQHSKFTGRSGTFFAFEGLGSVYWHMVSKLLLAAYESYAWAVERGAEPSLTAALAEAYYAIRNGLGFNKSPDVYGAFPTDPYSHTPWGGGASQPGMTGTVKEEILARWGELGLKIEQGILKFSPTLLRLDEFLEREGTFTYYDLTGAPCSLSLPPGSLAFTFCQTPIVYRHGEKAEIETVDADGKSRFISGHALDRATTQHVMDRDGSVARIIVTLPETENS